MNYNETKEYLKRYLKAKIPVITIKTVEKNRIIRLIKEIQDELNYNFSLYGMAEGLIDLKSNNVLSDEKTIMGVLDYISEELKVKQNSNYILTDLSDIENSSIISRFLVNIIEKAELSSSSIIIISNDNVWSNIQRLGISLKLNYPTEEELKETIINTIKPYQSQINIEWDENDYTKSSNYMQGLSEMEVKNIISSLLVKGSITKNDLLELKFTKQKLFNEIAGLEAINIDEDFEIAGLDNLKNWLNEKKILMDPNRKEELKERGIRPPKGLLLTGVPGCGKSLCSKAVSKIFDIPLYRLDLATVQGQYVGQSEKQLKEALDTAEYVSPCVLWIDEIEKGLNDNNSPVTSKLIGQFLFWLQENKKPVFVIASANSIESLPPELVRKGRFDEIFFVDLPNNNERSELIKLYFRKYLKVSVKSPFLDELVNITDGFASSDIEATIRSITYKLMSNSTVQLTEELIRNELKKVVSISKTNPEKIQKIRAWGSERAINASN